MGKIIKIIGLVALLVGAFFAYTVFFGSSSGSSTLLTSQGSASAPGSDLITLLLQLKSLQLDDSIFTNPLFASLKDFDVVIQPEPQGRANPFAPIGVEVNTGTVAASIPTPTPSVTPSAPLKPTPHP